MELPRLPNDLWAEIGEYLKLQDAFNLYRAKFTTYDFRINKYLPLLEIEEFNLRYMYTTCIHCSHCKFVFDDYYILVRMLKHPYVHKPKVECLCKFGDPCETKCKTVLDSDPDTESDDESDFSSDIESDIDSDDELEPIPRRNICIESFNNDNDYVLLRCFVDIAYKYKIPIMNIIGVDDYDLLESDDEYCCMHEPGFTPEIRREFYTVARKACEDVTIFKWNICSVCGGTNHEPHDEKCLFSSTTVRIRFIEEKRVQDEKNRIFRLEVEERMKREKEEKEKMQRAEFLINGCIKCKTKSTH